MLTVVTIILIFVVIIALFMAARYKEDNNLLNEEIQISEKPKRKVLKKTLNSQKKARK